MAWTDTARHPWKASIHRKMARPCHSREIQTKTPSWGVRISHGGAWVWYPAPDSSPPNADPGSSTNGSSNCIFATGLRFQLQPWLWQVFWGMNGGFRARTLSNSVPPPPGNRNPRTADLWAYFSSFFCFIYLPTLVLTHSASNTVALC